MRGTCGAADRCRELLHVPERCGLGLLKAEVGKWGKCNDQHNKPGGPRRVCDLKSCISSMGRSSLLSTSRSELLWEQRGQQGRQPRRNQTGTTYEMKPGQIRMTRQGTSSTHKLSAGRFRGTLHKTDHQRPIIRSYGRIIPASERRQAETPIRVRHLRHATAGAKPQQAADVWDPRTRSHRSANGDRKSKC